MKQWKFHENMQCLHIQDDFELHKVILMRRFGNDTLTRWGSSMSLENDLKPWKTYPLDEIMAQCNVGMGLREYIPLKRTKYAAKLWALATAEQSILSSQAPGGPDWITYYLKSSSDTYTLESNSRETGDSMNNDDVFSYTIFFRTFVLCFHFSFIISRKGEVQRLLLHHLVKKFFSSFHVRYSIAEIGGSMF